MYVMCMYYMYVFMIYVYIYICIYHGSVNFFSYSVAFLFIFYTGQWLKGPIFDSGLHNLLMLIQKDKNKHIAIYACSQGCAIVDIQL